MPTFAAPVRRLRSPVERARILLALLSLAGAVAPASCTAPQSQRAEGPIAEVVESAIASGSGRFDHEGWDRLLAAGTRDGLVDYGLFADRRDELEAYLERIAEAELAELGSSHLEALLMNAYNAYTVLTILEHPDVSSIREIDGVWTEITHPVGGHDLTLDEIEHELLRPFFRDPRIHVALNCASMSCAPLPPWAFDGDRLDEQLEEWTRRFFRDPGYLRIDANRLLVSKLLDWYGDDFTAEGWSPRADSLAGFIARYADDEVRRFIAEHDGDPKIAFVEYDWSLNRAPSERARA
jgi:hypothetical protein